MISNSETALHVVDARIRSRLASAEIIHFVPYTHQDLVDILIDRSDWGLIPGTVSRKQLSRVADMAVGDARAALGILSLAAQKSEEQSLEKIPDELLRASLPTFESDSRKRALASLHPAQQSIMQLLKTGTLPTGELYTQLNKKTPTVERTFRKHMTRLTRMGFIIATGEGRWREYSLK